MALQWLLADLRTGEVIGDAPDLLIDTVTHTLCQYDSTTVNLPIVAAPGRPKPPVKWLRGTQPMASMIAAIDIDSNQPAWAGLVTQRQRTNGAAAQLSLSTAEYYTSRRFIRDTLQYPQTDRLLIAQDLLTRYVADANGIPMRIVVLGSGVSVDGDYKDSDDKTVYSVLGDLGMEWTVGLEWLTNPDRIGFVAYLGERVGSPATAGLAPAVTFDYPGNCLTAQVIEDYSDGKGANDVMLSSTSSGSVRPQSDHQVQPNQDLPTVEYRGSAGSNITSKTTLNTYSLQTLQTLADGTTAVVVTAHQSARGVMSVGMGDDVGYDLGGPEFPDHPTGVLRMIGKQLSKTSISPVLASTAATDGGS